MKRAVFRLYRSRRVLCNPFAANSLARLLRADYLISLELDGQAVPIPVAGQERRWLPASWGTELKPEPLLDYVRRYRQNPANCRPETLIREGLHSFLFAERRLDGPFAQASPRLVFLEGDVRSRLLLLNIPWELANRVPQTGGPADNRASLVSQTMAGLPFARQLAVTSPAFDLGAPERLSVLYVLSEPPGAAPIGAREFLDHIGRSLRHREGMVDSRPLAGKAFAPSFDQLLAEIEQRPPHVLVLVCHGDTGGGVPQIQFERWYPVRELARALVKERKTLLTLLIACDQVFLDDGPSAHSGAMVLLEHGVPAVVAMQSSVRADLAASFLGTTLDHFLQTGNLAHATAAGRLQMAPSRTSSENYADWSFPALFVSQNAELLASEVRERIEGFVPALEQMLRAIPVPEPYLSRPEPEQRLAGFLNDPRVGLVVVAGPLGSGRTTLTRHFCREQIKAAIALRDTSFRHVLYIDLERQLSGPKSVEDLVELFRQQSEAVRVIGTTSPLLEWPQWRGTDGLRMATNAWNHLIHFLDNNRMVLVLDHLPESTDPVWAEFLTRVQTLLHSLVLAVTEVDTGVQLEAKRILRLGPLSPWETAAYVAFVGCSQGDQANQWYGMSGGNLLLLDVLRRSGGLPTDIDGRQVLTHQEIVRSYTKMVTQGLSDAQLALLGKMVHLASGVDSFLSSEFVGDWGILAELAQRGLLTQEYRFDLSSEWVRMPQLLAQGLGAVSPNLVAQGRESLADDIIVQLAPREGRTLEQNLIDLAKRDGGVPFLHQIHCIWLELECFPESRALAALLNPWLLRRGRWGDAFAFWDRLLHCPAYADSSEAYEWLLLAKSAHLLGRGQLAWECLANAAQRGLTPLDEIDTINLEAALLKDAGKTPKGSAKIHELYADALERIDSLRQRVQHGERADVSESEIAERRALVVYNRALVYAFWDREQDQALADLETASKEFGKLGLPMMQALADCEYVDVQLGRPGSGDCDELLRRLFAAATTFTGAQDWGDAAFCFYQVARCYRRRHAADSETRRVNLRKAVEAYQRARECAATAGDVRQAKIATFGAVEVSWRHLTEMSSEEAARQLDAMLPALKLFRGDAWSSRVLRDLLWLRAQVARTTAPATVAALLEQAWDVACRHPIDPLDGTDARRAACIMYDYLQEFEHLGRGLDADQFIANHERLIEGWLGQKIELVAREQLLVFLAQFAKPPGK